MFQECVAWFRKTAVSRWRLVPDADSVTGRLKQLDEILAELTLIPEIASGSANIKVKGLRDAVDDVKKKRLPLKADGTLDDSAWNNDGKLSADMKHSVYRDLTRLWKGACGLNVAELTVVLRSVLAAFRRSRRSVSLLEPRSQDFSNELRRHRRGESGSAYDRDAPE
jgi:hypothetical protein